MTVEVVVPKLGMAMSEGVLTEWLVKDGDSVKEGDEIVTIENEKSVQEIESPATGIIKLLANEGETYPVDTVLAEIN